MKSTDFFNFNIRQEVNQWICIAFMSAWCFAVIFYYFTHQTDVVGQNWQDDIASASSPL
jgi:hypothetical protein